MGSEVKKIEMRNKMAERPLEFNLLLGTAQLLPFGSLMFSGNLGIQLQSSEAIECLAKSTRNTLHVCFRKEWHTLPPLFKMTELRSPIDSDNVVSLAFCPLSLFGGAEET